VHVKTIILHLHPELDRMDRRFGSFGIHPHVSGSRVELDHAIAGPPAESLGAGTVIDGRYRLASAVVRHPTDAIYTALDERSRQRVRVRVTRQEPDSTLLALRHPGIPLVLAHGRVQAWHYVVTEWFDGSPLELPSAGHSRMDLPRQRAWATLAMDMLDVLEHIHRSAARPHGNLSLSSFWEGRDGRLRLIDLSAPDGALGSEDVPYASPERLRGMPRDERSDVYQAACVLHALAFGTPPYGLDVVEARSGHLLSRVPDWPACTPVLTPSLFAVLRTALEKQPHHRFAGAVGMRAAFAVALAELDREGAATSGTLGDVGETVIKTPAELLFPSDTLESAPAREERPARRGTFGWLVALAALVVFGIAAAAILWVAILGTLAVLATRSPEPTAGPSLPPLGQRIIAQQLQDPSDVQPAPELEPVSATVPVDFSTNGAYKPVVRATFAEFVELVREYPGLVKLTGHTDNRGPAEVNHKIGLARAWATRKLLVLAGIEAPRLPIDSKGETEPIGDNRTPEGRAQNRRVTAEFLPAGSRGPELGSAKPGPANPPR
jgi:outer membrane protein OmpA-like peptidoglycan-associated protein